MVLLAGVIWDALRDKVVTVGDYAPSFSITTESGKTVSPASFGGKILMVNFWASWCPPCVQETPALEALHRELGPRGLVLVGISVDKNETKYKNFLRRFRVSYLTGRDPDAKINDMYGTYRYPESYVINTEGKVLMKIVGILKEEDIKSIRMLLGGQG